MIITREQLKEVTGVDYYDGSIIHERFAYKFFKKQLNAVGNILAYVAPMEVTDNLIDLEDSLNKDYIYSESAMNFIMEIPRVDAFAGVAFQRLLNMQVGSLLCSKYLQKDGYVDGDDIMVFTSNITEESTEEKEPEAKKASVSIACEKSGAVLIHLGINLVAGERAPSFAYSTELSDEQALDFMADVCTLFYKNVADIFLATAKVIV
jgi:hypothetical protein